MRLYYDQTEFKSKIKNLTKTKQICCISRLGTQFLALYLKVWGTLKRVMNDFPAIYLIKSFPFNFELWKKKNIGKLEEEKQRPNRVEIHICSQASAPNLVKT